MKNIIPVSDLQRQAAAILKEVNSSSEPVIVTQRGRASAVIISAKRYAEIEEDLALLDDLELLQVIEEGKEAMEKGDTIPHEEVKRRLNFPG